MKNPAEAMLKKGNEMGWYSVPAWFIGEGILINNPNYSDGSILPENYVPDIKVKSKDWEIGYPFKGLIELLFAKKYRPVVQFKFGGKILRGIGSSKYMSWHTEEDLSLYYGRVGVVSLLYRDNKIETFYAHIIEGRINNTNHIVSNFNEVLNSKLFDEDASYHHLINRECIDRFPIGIE